MGFGGGGSGSFVLPNHDHTNAAADGGALDEAISLINDGAADVTFATWISNILASKAPIKQNVIKTADTTSTSTSLVDIPDLTLTMGGTGGVTMVTMILSYSLSTTSNSFFTFADGGTDQTGQTMKRTTNSAGYDKSIAITYTADRSSQIIKGRMKVTAGTINVNGTTDRFSYINCVEILA
jgi:hypothetical protein